MFPSPIHACSHTDTGIKLAGYQIERFDVILSTVLKAHSAIPFFGIIGWDVCVADDGRIVIIEFNPDPDLRMEQLPRDTCLKDYQDEILEEVYGLGHNSK